MAKTAIAAQWLLSGYETSDSESVAVAIGGSISKSIITVGLSDFTSYRFDVYLKNSTKSASFVIFAVKTRDTDNELTIDWSISNYIGEPLNFEIDFITDTEEGTVTLQFTDKTGRSSTFCYNYQIISGDD